MKFDTPAKYVLTEKALISAPDGNCKIEEAGNEISYHGLPSANMLPLDEEGVRRRELCIEYDKTGRFDSQPAIENLGAEANEAAEKARAAIAKVNEKRKAAGLAPLKDTSAPKAKAKAKDVPKDAGTVLAKAAAGADLA
jgi:hypothetical protein